MDNISSKNNIKIITPHSKKFLNFKEILENKDLLYFLILKDIKARYAQSTGSEPTLVEGKASPSGEQGFASWAQVTQAMSDPRYAKDPAYQAEVKNKLANSKI